MVRVGVLLNENRKPEPSLTESLRMVIEEFAVRHATQSNTEAFRAELQTPEVRIVFIGVVLWAASDGSCSAGAGCDQETPGPSFASFPVRFHSAYERVFVTARHTRSG